MKAKEMRSLIEVRIHDTSIGLWQDDAKDASFRPKVFMALLRKMRRRGWSLGPDEKAQQYKSIARNYRLGERDTLRCGIEITGRVVKVEYWSMTADPDNQHGRRYDFDKMSRSAYLDQLRVKLEFSRIIAWLETIAAVKVTRSTSPKMSALARIQKGYADSWHSDKELGRPVCKYSYNGTSADGSSLQQEQAVWFPDRKGRIIRGVAYYNINNMWWVVAGGELYNEHCGALFTAVPGNLRTKHNDRVRRTRLEKELAVSVARMDYKRADLIKTILFGREQAYLIWARDHSAYYRSQYCGYTSDRIAAGKYTKQEAEAECRRVPHELEMVCPDGSHVRFDQKAA